MALEICKNCKFYDSEEFIIEDIPYPQDCGACRRYPPRRIDGSNSGFPIVDDDCWCGEFKKKEVS